MMEPQDPWRGPFEQRWAAPLGLWVRHPVGVGAGAGVPDVPLPLRILMPMVAVELQAGAAVGHQIHMQLIHHGHPDGARARRIPTRKTAQKRLLGTLQLGLQHGRRRVRRTRILLIKTVDERQGGMRVLRRPRIKRIPLRTRTAGEVRVRNGNRRLRGAGPIPGERHTLR